MYNTSTVQIVDSVLYSMRVKYILHLIILFIHHYTV